jgi:hypothetical protein
MSDSASGSVDKSVQVKLVLLGKYFPFLLFCETDVVIPYNLSGEAAVGKSSVVLRFVCSKNFRS